MASSNSSFSMAYTAAIWRIISGMRSYIACHIPDRRSHAQIGFDRIRFAPKRSGYEIRSAVHAECAVGDGKDQVIPRDWGRGRCQIGFSVTD